MFSDRFDQHRAPQDAQRRVELYVERFLTLAREGSEGDDDENAPRIDVLDHVTLDVRDLRALCDEIKRLRAMEARARISRP